MKCSLHNLEMEYRGESDYGYSIYICPECEYLQTFELVNHDDVYPDGWDMELPDDDDYYGDLDGLPF